MYAIYNYMSVWLSFACTMAIILPSDGLTPLWSLWTLQYCTLMGHPAGAERWTDSGEDSAEGAFLRSSVTTIILLTNNIYTKYKQQQASPVCKKLQTATPSERNRLVYAIIIAVILSYKRSYPNRPELSCINSSTWTKNLFKRLSRYDPTYLPVDVCYTMQY